MHSSKGYCLLFIVKSIATLLRALPWGMALFIARVVGWTGYYVLPKKRRVVYANLKTVFAGRKSPAELRRISKKTLINFAQSIVEVLCFPKLRQLALGRFVKLKGREHVEQARAEGKGLILLAVHSGNWELANVVGSSLGYPYNLVANPHPKAPKLDALLNKYRGLWGAKIIAPGVATREIVRALKDNEIVILVLDQGGEDGSPVKFFGKTASMSTGAIRLGIKYGTPVCPVWINRTGPGRHCLTVFPPLELPSGDVPEKGMVEATRRAAKHFEGLLSANPEEYMWSYKVFKYTTEPHVLVLDDGRTGHLRQSQAVAQMLKGALAQRGKNSVERTVLVQYKSRFASKAFALYAFFAQYLPLLRREDALPFFLTKETCDALWADRSDFIISCGSSVGGLNFLLSRTDMARSICLLKPGLVSWDRFDLVIVPSHDDPPAALKTRAAVTKAALNLITPEYLKNQGTQLLNRYAHLKGNVRTKIGVLLGGDTKGVSFDEGQIRSLIRQLKEAALYFNADILFTTSRRTSPVIDALVAKEFRNFERCPLCIIANENNIPEAVGGILSLSELLVVSGESISMVSEAVSSGKRTIVFSPGGTYNPGSPSKYDHFVLDLAEQGYLVASSVKDLSMSIADMLRNKLTLKALNDRALVQKAIEGMLS